MLKIVFVILCTLSLASVALSECSPRPCPRCSSEVNPVWVIDDGTCRVFKNACLLATENCERCNGGQSELTRVPHEICKAKCQSICNLKYDPVCAAFKGDKRTFGNICQLNVHICQSGKYYQIVYKGECQKY